MFQLLLTGLFWLLGWLATIIKWLAKNTFWWIELDPAEDALMRAAILRSQMDAGARAAFANLVQAELPAVLTEEYVLAQLLFVFPPAGNERDAWVCLMARLDDARKKEANAERKAHIRAAMDLLFAFNRDNETAMHHRLATEGAPGSLTTRYIKHSYDYCQRQMHRFETGVAWFPIGQRGKKLDFLEAIAFYLCLLGIFLINGLTEVISYGFGEYVGVARNGIQRPRTLFQIFVALFNRKNFNLTDGPFIWEIGRQRTLGATLTFLMFTIAYFRRSLYRKTPFIIGVGVGATVFQIAVQLGDLAWFRLKCLNVAKEVRPGLEWYKLMYAWIRGRIPVGTQQDRDAHSELAKFNSRSAAWAKTYTKSKPMSLLWIEFARNRAAPRYYFAARAGVVSKATYNLAFFQKLLFPTVTLGSWTLSAYALWRQWQIFTIAMAFHTIAVLKGLDLVYAPEQEVPSAANVWCNMIGPGIPTIGIVLLPRAANEMYLSDPKDLRIIMPTNFFVTQWTDLIANGLTAAMNSILGNRA